MLIMHTWHKRRNYDNTFNYAITLEMNLFQVESKSIYVSWENPFTKAYPARKYMVKVNNGNTRTTY